MNRARRLIGNLTLLNVLLAAALLGAVFYAAWPFFSLGVDAAPAAVAEPAPAAVEPAAAAGRSPMDFAMVTEQNLFHPERRIPDRAVKELPRPDLVLYGTLITGETSIAYVEDRKAPYSTPGRGKRQLALKKGDNMGGYILQAIEPTRIVLAKGDDRMVVNLDSKDSRSSGAASAQAAPGRPVPVAPSPRPSVMPGAGGASATPAQPGAAAIGQQPAPSGVQKKPVLLPGQLRMKKR